MTCLLDVSLNLCHCPLSWKFTVDGSGDRYAGRLGRGVDVGVHVGVGVDVAVGVDVGVPVAVGVGVTVAV